MKYWSKLKHVMKYTCCFLAFAMTISIAAGSSYALTQGQKSVGNIGADITWYNYGDFKDYFIQEDDATGLYYLSMSNESSGICESVVVDSKGENALKPVGYTGFSSYIGGGNGVSILKTDNSHYYSIDSDGVKAINGDAYREIGDFYNGYATVTLKSDSNKGVADINGNLLFEDKEGKYKAFRYLGSGIFSAEVVDNEYDFLDASGTLLTKTPYNNDWLRDVSEETIPVSKDGKYGFLDLSGQEIIPCIYDDANSFREGLAAVCKNGKWGFIDKTGKEVIPNGFDVAISFRNGLAKVSSNEKWGLIDKAGAVILPIENDYIIDSENGGYTVSKDGNAFLLDASGKLSVSGDYSFINPDANGKMFAGKTVSGTSVGAYFDENQAMLTGFKEFSLLYLSDKLYLGIKRGEYPEGIVPPHDYAQKFALLDSGGNNLTGFKYSNAGNFFNNFQVVNRYYYGSAGLVNQYGAEVIPTIFDDILLTDEGYAFVTISDKTGGNSRVGYFKIPDSFSDRKATRPITVYLNGTELYFDSEPTIKNQNTMVPLRKISEALGSSVEWNNTTKTVTAVDGDKNISLTIGSDTAYVNGLEIQLEAAPFIQEDTTFVPLRFVSENLGADVKWDGDLRRVIITTKKN